MEDLSRREFTKKIFYKSGVLFTSGLASYFIFDRYANAETLYNKLSSDIRGRVIKETVRLVEYSYDFGHGIRKEPRVVIVPESKDDISTTLRIANEYGVPVSIRGCGHGCMGLCLSDGGIVIHNNSEQEDFSVKDGIVSAASSMKMLDLETALNRQGLSMPVLTCWLELTLGGVLSAGGVGGFSVRKGALVNNISELELTTPSGKVITCSHEKNPDLFRYSLSGLGQVGVINRCGFKAEKQRKYGNYLRGSVDTIYDVFSMINKINISKTISNIDSFYIVREKRRDRSKIPFEFMIGKNFETLKEAEGFNMADMFRKYGIQGREEILEDFHFRFFEMGKRRIFRNYSGVQLRRQFLQEWRGLLMRR